MVSIYQNSTFTFLLPYFLLRKKGKFDGKTYYKVYPSDAIPPRLCRVIKAHKPGKTYPMRTILSAIELAPYGTSKYLVEIIQTSLSKNKHRVIDSYAFVEEAKTWEIYQDEVLSVPKN